MEAFAAKTPIWDYEHIYEFIKSPQAYIPGTKMTFVGLKKPEDRINVIAYLHTQGSSLPIPKPNPAAAAPPAAAGAPAATGSTAGAGTAGQGTTAKAGGPAGQGEGAPGGAPATTSSSKANPGAGKPPQ
jgi:cytochrome c